MLSILIYSLFRWYRRRRVRSIVIDRLHGSYSILKTQKAQFLIIEIKKLVDRVAIKTIWAKELAIWMSKHTNCSIWPVVVEYKIHESCQLCNNIPV